MIIHHNLGDIYLDDEDAVILKSWQFCTVQNQGRWQYAILYGDREGGVRRSKYLSRAVMGVIDPKLEVTYRDGNGLNCSKSNLVVQEKSWITRKKKKTNAKCFLYQA